MHGLDPLPRKIVVVSRSGPTCVGVAMVLVLVAGLAILRGDLGVAAAFHLACALYTTDRLWRMTPGEPVCVRENGHLLRRWTRFSLALPVHCRTAPPLAPAPADP